MRNHAHSASRVTLVVTSVVAALGLMMPVGAGASTATTALRAQPSDDVCEAVSESYSIELVLAFLTGFAQAFEGLDATDTTDAGATDTTTATSSPTADELESSIRLAFSPKLERVTGTLAQSAPKSIRKLFAKQQAVYADGIQLLEDAGVTKKQLKALAELDITASIDAEELVDDTSISKQEFAAAAKKFESRMKDLDPGEEATAAQEKVYVNLGSQCGVFPIDETDCDVLVSNERVEELLGGPATTENDNGTCDYTATTDDSVDTPELAVELYPNERAFDRLVKDLEDPEKISADAYTAEPFVTPASFGFKTCGKTLYTRVNSRTVVVAYCPPGDGEVDVDQLVEVADVASQSLDA
ncbi:MAG: hypothetical protein WEC34_01020 [Acidimicrobiia bacterium]